MMPFKPVLREECLLIAGMLNIVQFIQEYYLLYLVADLANEGLILLLSRTHFYLLIQTKLTVHLYATNWSIPFLNPKFKI